MDNAVDSTNTAQIDINEALNRLSDNEFGAYIIIERYWKETNGSFPTFDFLAEEIGTSKSVAHYYVMRLVDAGLVIKIKEGDGRRASYAMAGARLSIDRSTLIEPNERAFRRR